MSMSTEHIHLEGLKIGNKTSFRAIYQLHHESIYFYCLRFLIQDSLAEEATADVFIKLWQKREIIDTSHTVAPFLFKLAKDIAYNYLRKIASDNRLKVAYLENYPLMDICDGEQSLIEQESMRELDKWIAQLPPKRRAIFKLRYEEELDYHTIAKRLDISPHTVKVQLVKARKFLKEHMMESAILLVVAVFA